MVGVTGLEPATSRPPAVRATRLRYTPTCLRQIIPYLRVQRQQKDEYLPQYISPTRP
jgi:hypothetical protein